MEEWDDEPTTPAPASNIGVAVEGGRKFSSGRGFKSVQDDGGDTWGSSNTGWNENSNNFNDNHDSGDTGRGGRGGGRGRGGRSGDRGRGGGRGRDRGDYRNMDSNKNGGWGENEGDNNDEGGWGDNKDSGWGGDGSNGNNWSRDERRGREGRGGGRGRGRGEGRGGGFGRQDGDFGSKSEGQKDEKPRENYIPVERTTTDQELFTSTITTGINFIKLDEIEVNVSGEDVPPPIESFESSGLRPHLLENVVKSGYKKPTPIQKHAIPIIMNGRDLMGCAQTGSGKTAAFLLPIIHKMLSNQETPIVEDNCSQPNVVIVSPTRELTIQIYEQAKKFACNSIIKIVVAYGGTSVSHQRNHVLAGCHILVATPGRLNDFVKRKHVSFASVQFFVLDEADRMLDMGFLPTVEEMMGDPTMIATGERQTLMFSATFPEQIQHLAGKFLHNYIFIAVGIVGSASSDVEQIFYQVSKYSKREKLLELIREDPTRTVVFVETKRNADFLATLLSEHDIKTTSIHGDRLQREREQALWDFKKGICNTLVATGVAARGLDIEGIQHVINYDLPNSIDEYVHRIGRTGRVGNRGKATSFFDPDSDGAIASGLTKIMQQAGQEVPAWLAQGDFSSHKKDSFGGRDIRGGDFGGYQNFDSQPAEADEEW